MESIITYIVTSVIPRILPFLSCSLVTCHQWENISWQPTPTKQDKVVNVTSIIFPYVDTYTCMDMYTYRWNLSWNSLGRYRGIGCFIPPYLSPTRHPSKSSQTSPYPGRSCTWRWTNRVHRSILLFTPLFGETLSPPQCNMYIHAHLLIDSLLFLLSDAAGLPPRRCLVPIRQHGLSEAYVHTLRN